MKALVFILWVSWSQLSENHSVVVSAENPVSVGPSYLLNQITLYIKESRHPQELQSGILRVKIFTVGQKKKKKKARHNVNSTVMITQTYKPPFKAIKETLHFFNILN